LSLLGTTTTWQVSLGVDFFTRFPWPVPDGATSVERDAAGQPARLGTPAAVRLVGVSPRTLEKHRIYGTGAGDAMTARLIVLGTVAMAVAAIGTTMELE
jgi:hypothetical protein